MKKFFHIHKKSFFQVMGMLIAYIFTKHFIFIVIAGLLALILIWSPRTSQRITAFLDKVIGFIGMMIKKLMLSVVFFFIFLPVGILLRLLKSKDEKRATFYVPPSDNIDFKKMW